jgi:hypothetical protein
MSEFKLDEQKLPYICQQLGINNPDDEALVKTLCRDFLYFYEDVRTQHLSPIVMALEHHIRVHNDKKDFKIIIKEMRNSTAKNGVAFLHWGNGKYQYEIALPMNQDEVKLRYIVAHELSHLFYVMNCLHGERTAPLVKDAKYYYLVDKMADVLGIFTILERTDFYKTKAPKMCRDKWEEVVEDFVQMSKGRKPLQNALRGTERK